MTDFYKNEGIVLFCCCICVYLHKYFFNLTTLGDLKMLFCACNFSPNHVLKYVKYRSNESRNSKFSRGACPRTHCLRLWCSHSKCHKNFAPPPKFRPWLRQWTRMTMDGHARVTTDGPRVTTDGHEWPRMDTSGHGWTRVATSDHR
jgi:hypothetical protein